MLKHLAVAMMGADRFILITALEEDARLHDAAIRAVGMSEDFAPIYTFPEISKCQTFYRYEDKPRQNNDWRKGNKRGFKGAVYGGH